MKIEIEVPDSHIDNLLQSARIDYWCAEEAGLWAVLASFSGAVFVTPDMGGPVVGWYSLDLKRAVTLAAAKYPRLLDLDRVDAEAGDMFIQLAAFGHIVFG